MVDEKRLTGCCIIREMPHTKGERNEEDVEGKDLQSKARSANKAKDLSILSGMYFPQDGTEPEGIYRDNGSRGTK